MLIKERLKEIVLSKIYMREVRRDIRKARECCVDFGSRRTVRVYVSTVLFYFLSLKR